MCCLCSGQFAAQPLWQGFRADPRRPLTHCWEFESGYWGADEGLALLDLPRGVFPLSVCLCRFTRTVIPQKTEPGFDILNPKRDLLRSLCISWSPPGVVEAIHWNSISYLCPLKSQYGVRESLPALSWHTLLLSPSSPSYATDPTGYSQIRHMSSVYLLINCCCKLLCSKNGMSELSGLGKNNRSWWHNILSYRETNNSSSRFFWGELVSYQACWVCSPAFVSQSKMAP